MDHHHQSIFWCFVDRCRLRMSICDDTSILYGFECVWVSQRSNVSNVDYIIYIYLYQYIRSCSRMFLYIHAPTITINTQCMMSSLFVFGRCTVFLFALDWYIYHVTISCFVRWRCIFCFEVFAKGCGIANPLNTIMYPM